MNSLIGLKRLAFDPRSYSVLELNDELWVRNWGNYCVVLCIYSFSALTSSSCVFCYNFLAKGKDCSLQASNHEIFRDDLEFYLEGPISFVCFGVGKLVCRADSSSCVHSWFFSEPSMENVPKYQHSLCHALICGCWFLSKNSYNNQQGAMAADRYMMAYMYRLFGSFSSLSYIQFYNSQTRVKIYAVATAMRWCMVSAIRSPLLLWVGWNHQPVYLVWDQSIGDSLIDVFELAGPTPKTNAASGILENAE